MTLILYMDLPKARKLFLENINDNNLRKNKYKELCDCIIKNSLSNNIFILDINYRYLAQNKTMDEYIQKYHVFNAILEEMLKFEDCIPGKIRNDFYFAYCRHLFIGFCKEKKDLDSFALIKIKKINGKVTPGQIGRTINELFFQAIEDDACKTIMNKVQKLFQLKDSGEYCFISIASFIEETLLRYPKKIKLWFLLGEYYSYIGDKQLAKDSYNNFMKESKNILDINLVKNKISTL